MVCFTRSCCRRLSVERIKAKLQSRVEHRSGQLGQGERRTAEAGLAPNVIWGSCSPRFAIEWLGHISTSYVIRASDHTIFYVNQTLLLFLSHCVLKMLLQTQWMFTCVVGSVFVLTCTQLRYFGTCPMHLNALPINPILTAKIDVT